MKLLNVRLNPDDARIAAELRKDGVELSGVVREAIRAVYRTRRGRRARQRNVSEIMARIYAEFPDPPGRRKPRYDLRDGKSLRRLIAAHLRKGRR